MHQNPNVALEDILGHSLSTRVSIIQRNGKIIPAVYVNCGKHESALAGLALESESIGENWSFQICHPSKEYLHTITWKTKNPDYPCPLTIIARCTMHDQHQFIDNLEHSNKRALVVDHKTERVVIILDCKTPDGRVLDRITLPRPHSIKDIAQVHVSTKK